MVQVEELLHLIQRVSIDASDPCGRESHSNDSLRNVGEVKVKLFRLESEPVLTDQLMNTGAFDCTLRLGYGKSNLLLDDLSILLL
jgi:hypothetical protein